LFTFLVTCLKSALGGARLGALFLYYIAMSLCVFRFALFGHDFAMATKAPVQNVVSAVGAVVCLRE
jgi:hypothetical protein